jgi:hypothetical protein
MHYVRAFYRYICIFSYCIYDVTILFGLLVVAALSVLVGVELCCVLVGHHSRSLCSFSRHQLCCCLRRRVGCVLLSGVCFV